MTRSITRLPIILAALCSLALPALPVAAASRIKDIAAVEGIRENQLIGYGLVVGLNGTGDTVRNSPFTQQSIAAMLERMGINAKGVTMKPENVAAVMVTANLPAFARQGTRIDVTVSSMGDASDLNGGTLLVTPLLGADGEVYAVAQGAMAVGGFSAGGDAATIVQGVPTSGRVSNGAIVERETTFQLSDLNKLHLALHNPDLTTARRMAAAINTHMGERLAEATDPSTVLLNRPVGYKLPLVELLAEIEQLSVTPDQRAKVVIDERTGTIVLGSEVRINSVAIAQGNLTIRISETPVVSQPNAFGEGETTVVPRTQVDVTETGPKQLGILQESVSLQQLVDGLNALGVGPRDMISILQAIKAAGAMQAEIQVM
ncbi:flagellar basal body P-ring protein FlgI [Gimibacter soli]|uniref:Flagellar P-ring protein n=1 Tax=Gimibacter soli TaxID=3024400 RepID=A0AAE9XTH7_9PROT|nr:flagellar basal body P-ring protein FlgI [Gimibacter soli]WCL53043.1 flagellar basal body P-ring protein FlgI [Gimibacter soli]